MCSVDTPAVAPDAMVHTAGVPLTPAAIILAVTREETPHLPAAISTPAMAPPSQDKPAARPRGIDVAFFLASWDWLRQYLENKPPVRHEGEGLLPVAQPQTAQIW